MNRSRRQRLHGGESGLTMIELIVVVVLVVIVAGLTGRMFTWGVDMFDFISARKGAMQGSRIGMEIVTKDLRSLIDTGNIATANNSTLVFTNLSNETVALEFDAGTLERNGSRLIEGLTSFVFTYYDINGQDLGSPVTDPVLIWKIDFSLNATIDGNPFHLESSVIPRSF